MQKIRVDVIDSQGNQFNGIFSTQADADKWIADHKTGWGTDAVPAIAEVKAVAPQPAVLNADGTIKTPAVAEVKAVAAVSAKPATYTVTQTDISAQYQADAELNVALKAQSLGSEVVGAVYRLNSAADVTTTQLLAMMNDPTLAMAERLLWAGSLESAKVVIATLSTQMFTADQIAQIQGFIDMKINELNIYEQGL